MPFSGHNHEALRTLLRDLINIYSPTGKEHEIVGFLFSYLKGGGLPVKMQEIGGGRANLLVIPPEREIAAVLVGHLDTVAAHDLELFGCREKGDLIVAAQRNELACCNGSLSFVNVHSGY